MHATPLTALLTVLRTNYRKMQNYMRLNYACMLDDEINLVSVLAISNRGVTEIIIFTSVKRMYNTSRERGKTI